MLLRDVLSPSFNDFRKPATPMVVPTADSDCCCQIVARRLLTPAQMSHAARRYLLGCSRTGRTIFWMRDNNGTFRDGHVGTSWVSLMLCAREPRLLRFWHARHCLFGLHLLADSPIAIVDTEQAAVILSEVYPAMTWMAHASYLTLDLLEPLRRHQVVLFPRTDETLSNYLFHEKVAELARQTYRLDITVSTVLEDHATPQQKQRHADLVDFLFDAERMEPSNDAFGASKPCEFHVNSLR